MDESGNFDILIDITTTPNSFTLSQIYEARAMLCTKRGLMQSAMYRRGRNALSTSCIYVLLLVNFTHVTKTILSEDSFGC